MTSPDGLGPGGDLIYRLRRLGMSGTVLHLGAHPDDEEVGTIAYLSRGRDIRTVYWSATRGEGGQNRHGPERAEALGIVRTWESLDARKVDGGEVLYGPFYDYGFSKRGEAALAAWGGQEVVKEIARAIRMVQPQVVVSRWSGGPEDGHGQHQAIGLAVPEAFEAAADPGRYPDLRALGLGPWRAQKLYVSAAPDWQPGEDGAFRSMVAPPGEGVLVLATGGLDPVSGRTFQELGCEAFNRHRTQGMAFLPQPGPFFYSYRRVRSLVPVSDPERELFDGLDPTLTGLADHPGGGSGPLRQGLEEVRARVDRAIAAFRADRPAGAGQEVMAGLTALRRVVDGVDGQALDEDDRAALRRALRAKVQAFEDVAARCLGLRLECLAWPPRVIPGGELRATVRLWNHGPERVEAVGVEMSVPEGWVVRPRRTVGREEPAVDEPAMEARFDVSVADQAELSCPYWLREPRGLHRYVWPAAGPLGLPFDPPLVSASCHVAVGEQPLSVRAEAVHRETFVGGFRELSPAVLPQMALEPREASQFLPTRSEPQSLVLQVAVRSVHEGGAKGTLGLEVPAGWEVDPAEIDLALPGPGESHSVRTKVTVPAEADPGVYDLHYQVTSGDRRHGVVMRSVRLGGPGIPRPADGTNFVAEAFVISPADVAVHLLDVEFVRTLRHGYIRGAEEQILPSLARFGLDMTVLGEEDVRYADLSAFDSIVVGPNAYVLREDVRANAARLLQYVDQGGTLIVQHQGYEYEAEGLAPYRFRYHQPHDRVTTPDAPVLVLDPGHAMLHVPNAITAADFEGWILDRGLYFFGQWDPAYAPVLASHDPGEEPKAGGLVVAAYGRGTYVYAAYSFFKQIPSGVRGALRLFANLLAIPEARILERMKLARRLPLLAFLTDHQLHEVVRLMSEHRFESGTVLARQGEVGGELYLVVDGEVEVSKEGERGRQTFVAGEGEAVGELAALAGVPRSATLRARGDARVLTMRGDHFRALLREHPDLADGVIQMLASRLATTEQAEWRSGSG